MGGVQATEAAEAGPAVVTVLKADKDVGRLLHARHKDRFVDVGNSVHWRKFTFSPITTSKIRVTINAVSDSWSRVVEIQAFGTSAGGEKVQWLITDHLGTPRMVLDQTGNLSSMKRHDYLPFGEEIVAPTGGRSAAQGYAGGDGVRQQFTQKERDVETGLDYFNARYYSSVQGRFTSPDSLLESSEKSEPQSWNRYSITINNPLKYVDPDGLRYVQRTLPDGTIEYGWCATDACYDQAIDTSAKDYVGWTPVTFDESKPFTYRTTPGIGGELFSSYTLNPDGIHGFTRILEGGSAGLTTDWGAQLAIGGIFKSLFSLLDAGIESLGTRATTTAVTTQAVESWPGPGGGRVIIRGIEYTEHALERMVPRGLGERGVPP